jgi:CRISPR-associated endoribonuclease Cas6
MRTVTFALLPLRYVFSARDDIFFPKGKSGNVLRGAFGGCFRQVASKQTYSRIFESRSDSAGPSGLFDLPRPFVFRSTHLDGRVIRAGEQFHFDLHLFITADPPLHEMSETFDRLANQGFGPGRGRANLIAHPQPEPIEVSLAPLKNAVHRICVSYITPTELKANQALSERPEFPVVFSRARDRVATLRALYGEGPLGIDFRGMGERSRDISMKWCELRHVDVKRRSSRTGQTHPIGGFVGEAEYEGENLAEFIPFLRAAEWTGIGRQTVWGKGQIQCEEIS